MFQIIDVHERNNLKQEKATASKLLNGFLRSELNFIFQFVLYIKYT